MHAERLTCIVLARQCGSFLSWQGLCYWKSLVEIYVLPRLEDCLHCEGPRTKLEILKLGVPGRFGVIRNNLILAVEQNQPGAY